MKVLSLALATVSASTQVSAQLARRVGAPKVTRRAEEENLSKPASLSLSMAYGDVSFIEGGGELSGVSSKSGKSMDIKPKSGKSKSSKSVTDSCAHRVADQIGWSNWFDTIETFSPVFRVKTDEDLRKIIKMSRKGADGGTRCTVRVTGATHSEDGLVMQRTETDVVIVSLVDHMPDDPAWAPSADPVTGRVRLLSGQSWYEATALYRPHGLVLRERAGGRFFSVGGVIANPVHGGSKMGGFIHSDVTKMLVMTSNGKISEIEGDELKYWRSSAGQLGIILAVEMQLIKEVEKGGSLSMKVERKSFSDLIADPSNPTFDEINAVVGSVTQEVYTIIASSDHNEFFFDWYSNQLAGYFTDFSGPPFNDALAAQYDAAAQEYLELFGQDVAFTGGLSLEIPDDLCEFLCQSGTGNPPTGDGTVPCDPIPSPSGGLLCDKPVEVAAAFSNSTIENTMGQFLASGQTINDGYLTDLNLDYRVTSLIFPARAFPHVFATWWQVHAAAVGAYFNPNNFPYIPFRHIPNNVLEFRFINPQDTAVMNPIMPFAQWKADFDSAYFDSFDDFFPPIHGVPDGLISMEVISLKGVNDDEYASYFALLEQAWRHIPVNPLARYGPNTPPSYGPIVQDCDLASGVVLCASVNEDGQTPFANPSNSSLPCCNPRVPVNFHIAKGWGHGIDPETTPTTGEPVIYHDQTAIDAVFASPGKAGSINEFNAKIAEYDAEVFVGGALLRWLRPDEAQCFEPRKLAGQECGSAKYASDPGVECLSGHCDIDNLKCVEPLDQMY